MRALRTLWTILLLLASARAALGAAQFVKPLTLEEALRSSLWAGADLRHPAWSPDGERVYFIRPAGSPTAGDLCFLDVSSAGITDLKSVPAFSAALGEILSPGEAKTVRFRSFLLSPGGRFLFLRTDKGASLVWEIGSEKAVALPLEDAGAPAWSPDETRLAYTSAHGLWVVERSGGKPRSLRAPDGPAVLCGEPDWLYGEELDLKTAFWWSPDGRSIAYLRFDEAAVPSFPILDESSVEPSMELQRYPKPGDKNPDVSLRIVDAVTGADRGLAGAESGDGYLAAAAWTPDGSGLLTAWLNRDQDRLVLRRVDAATGESRTVYEETSPSWVNLWGDPVFVEGGKRFLWISERDGFAHVLSVPVSGGPPVQLTRGPWVVDEIAGVDEKRGRLYVSGNRDNPLGSQLYAADLRGRRSAVRLTPVAGWASATTSPDGRRALVISSAVTAPDAASLMDLGTGRSRPLPVAGPDLASRGFVKPEFVEIGGPGGQVLYGKLTRPADFDPARRYPVIMEIYGGPHAQLVQDKWAPRWEPWNQFLAQRGFVTFTLDNRGSARRGKAFEEVLLKRLGRAELEDQLAGVAYLKTLSFVDPERIGVWGWSYGGFMTCYALTHTGAFRCGVAVAPVTDWRNYDSCYTERYLKLPADNPKGYDESAPVKAAGNLSGRLMIAHGLVDDNVHFANSVQMTDALIEAGEDFQTAYYPRMDHGIRGPEARRDLFTRMAGFFEQTLAPR